MTPTQALDLVKDTLVHVVPDADVAAIGPDEKFRDRLDMDSLDFLRFVETLAEQGDCRIDEDDYPALTTLSGCARMVAARTGVGA